MLAYDSISELVQEDFNVDRVSAELRSLVEDEGRRAKMLDGYARIRKALGDRGASAAVARSMVEELKG